MGLGDWDLGLDNLKVKNTYFQEENKMLTKVNYCGGHSRKWLSTKMLTLRTNLTIIVKLSTNSFKWAVFTYRPAACIDHTGYKKGLCWCDIIIIDGADMLMELFKW